MKDMIQLLSSYIRIDTSGPHAAYDDVIALFAAQAAHDELPFRVIRLASGKPVFIITLQGTHPSLPALLLNHHMDVVPAPLEGWSYPPFGGVIDGDLIIGRGAQDMKGVGVAHYAALRLLAKRTNPIERTIHLIGVPDEEQGGFQGTGLFVDTKEFRDLKVGFVLDEGLPSGRQRHVLLKVSERKAMQVRFIASGNTAHASLLEAHNPVHELLIVLQSIQRLHQASYTQRDLHPAGLLLSAHITALNAGVYNSDQHAINMIPECASATIDFRIPSTMENRTVKQMLSQLLEGHPTCRMEIIRESQESVHEQLQDNQLYHAIMQAVADLDLSIEPLHFQATTDLRYYRARGVQGYGLTPFCSVPNLHGVNEAITLHDFKQGIDMFYRILVRMCDGQEEL